VYSDGETRVGATAFDGYDHRRMEPAYAWAAQLLAGYHRSEVQGFAARARAESLANPIDAEQRVGTTEVTTWARYYDQQRDLIATLRRAGFDVWIVSASPEYVVETWALGVGIGPERVVGIRTLRDRQRRLTYDLAGCGDVADGENTLIPYIDGKRCWVNTAIFGVTGAAAL
jgi:phosphoserine phosphatase